MQSQISITMQQAIRRSCQDTNDGSRRARSRWTPRGQILLLVLAASLVEPTACWFNFEPPVPQTQTLSPLSVTVAQLQPQQSQVRQTSSPVELAREVATSALSNIQPTVKTEASELASQPPVAGKILPEEMRPAENQSSTSSEKLAQAVLQVIKARKSPSDPSTQTSSKRVQSAEQQILSQHARIHSYSSDTHHHHQRLLPSKHRDQKLGDSYSSSSSVGRDSPLNSLLGHLKSGISSRSSIVKAISDNKLARTMATVGKSIGGNRYVAGAAALAALGLTFSKLLSPYIYANSYSKMNADPMLASGSYLAPSLSGGAYFGSGPDRTFYYPAGSAEADMLLSSGSGLIKSTSPAYSFVNYEPASLAQLESSASPIYQEYYPTSVKPSSYGNEQYYYTYTPVGTTSSNRLAGTGSQANSQGDTQGHYTSFYSSQPAGESHDYRDYLPSAELSPMGSSSSASSSKQQQQYADQLIPSASFDSPTAQLGAKFYSNPSAPLFGPGNSHRSGPVALKMDSATKLRLQQHLQSQLASGNRWSAAHSANANNQYESKAIQSSASQQAAQSARSSRLEMSQVQPVGYASRAQQQPAQSAPQVHASASSDKLEQGQDLVSSGSASKAAYLLIRPKGQPPAGGQWKSVSSPSSSMTITTPEESGVDAAEQQLARPSYAADSNGVEARTRISRTQPTGKSVKGMNDETHKAESNQQWQQMATLAHQQQQHVASPQAITNLIRLTAEEESNDHDNKQNGDNSNSHGNNDSNNNNNNVIKHIESLTSQSSQPQQAKTSSQDKNSESASEASSVVTGELTPADKAQLASDETGEDAAS